MLEFKESTELVDSFLDVPVVERAILKQFWERFFPEILKNFHGIGALLLQQEFWEDYFWNSERTAMQFLLEFEEQFLSERGKQSSQNLERCYPEIQRSVQH